MGRLNIVKMTVLPNVICRLSEVIIGILMAFFPEQKKILKFLWVQKKLIINSNAVGTIIVHLKPYYRGILSKTA